MSIVERFANTLEPTVHPSVSPEAAALVKETGVIDLHCDAPLFEKDLTKNKTIGHVDFPRLVSGNVHLQIHAVATKLPLGFNHTKTVDNPIDVLTLLYALMFSRMTFK